MQYSAAQKVYFQLELVKHILEDLDMEFSDLDLDGFADDAQSLIQEMSSEAYSRASAESK